MLVFLISMVVGFAMGWLGFVLLDIFLSGGRRRR